MLIRTARASVGLINAAPAIGASAQILFSPTSALPVSQRRRSNVWSGSRVTIRSDCCTGFSSVVRGKERSTWSQPLIHQINLANRSVSPRASWVSNTGSYTGLCCRPDNGERLARRWCAACHVVASDQRGLTGEEPPFATITAKPDFDAPRLAFFLLEPHPKMPNMQLSRSEAADLAAYIATLK
jgi:Cytochrome c